MISRSTGALIGFGIFAIPLLLLGVWVWEETPRPGGAGGAGPDGGPDVTEEGALAVALERPGPGELRLTFANSTKRKLKIVVPGRAVGVLRIVEAGAPTGPPRALSYRDQRDAVVPLLPGASYTHRYRSRPDQARMALEAIYDSRGPGLPTGVWRGVARCGPAQPHEESRAGDGGEATGDGQEPSGG